MTAAHAIADHYLASAHATRDHARFGSPEDLLTALNHFHTAGTALHTLHDVDPHTLIALKFLRSAAALGDYATAQTHHTAITT